MAETMGDRNEVRITLSDKAMEEFQSVANWLNIPLATMLRQHVEEYHRSPSFKSLVDRARKEREANSARTEH